MKHEEMSDFELNRKLFQMVMGCSDSFMERNTAALVQYCTDWNATMPLAVEHGVCVSIRKDNTSLIGLYGDCPDEAEKGKELRAIVICLIKVLEANNGQVI